MKWKKRRGRWRGEEERWEGKARRVAGRKSGRREERLEDGEVRRGGEGGRREGERNDRKRREEGQRKARWEEEMAEGTGREVSQREDGGNDRRCVIGDMVEWCDKRRLQLD